MQIMESGRSRRSRGNLVFFSALVGVHVVLWGCRDAVDLTVDREANAESILAAVIPDVAARIPPEERRLLAYGECIEPAGAGALPQGLDQALREEGLRVIPSLEPYRADTTVAILVFRPPWPLTEGKYYVSADWYLAIDTWAASYDHGYFVECSVACEAEHVGMGFSSYGGSRRR